MSKRDLLKSEYLVVFRNTRRMVVASSVNNTLFLMSGFNVKADLEHTYSDDLLNFSNSGYDIMEIWSRVTEPTVAMLNTSYRKLIWKRPEVKEMTMIDICKALGYEVKIKK